MKRIPIFFSFDNNYVLPASVAFASLLLNADKDTHYDMYVVHKNITQENQNILSNQVKSFKNNSLTFINLTGKIEINFSDKFSKGHSGSVFTVDSLYRCLPTLIPEFDKYDKIIYSDVDICIVDDISELFAIDLTDSYLASFRCPKFLEHQVEYMPEKIKRNYFGGGLWVMNLSKMRKDNLGSKIMEIIQNPPFFFPWPDQDVMNLACDTKVKYFSYRYVSIPDWQPMLEKKHYYDEYYPNNELYDAMYRPKILHYAARKPWKTHTLKDDVWFYYLSKTPFADSVQPRKEKFRIRLFGIIPVPFIGVKKGTNKIKIHLYKIPLLKIMTL